MVSAWRTGSQLAHRAIRDRILSGEFPPARLGMSPVPVAEALQRLEEEGIIESRPRSGTRVRIPTPEEVHGYYLVREALESQAARLISECATARQRQELARMARRVDAAYAAYAASPQEPGPCLSMALQQRRAPRSAQADTP